MPDENLSQYATITSVEQEQEILDEILFKNLGIDDLATIQASKVDYIQVNFPGHYKFSILLGDLKLIQETLFDGSRIITENEKKSSLGSLDLVLRKHGNSLKHTIYKKAEKFVFDVYMKD